MTVQEELAMLSSLREYVSSCICEDPSLKEELIKDPKSFILARLTDLDESDLKDIDFKVVDEPSGSIILPIPTVPEDMDLDELESVAGGFIFTAKAIAAGITAVSKAAAPAAGAVAAGVAINALNDDGMRDLARPKNTKNPQNTRPE
ncbi:hypothetical protein [Synechococcus sp. UW179A]|uniref:hypothetical protein n=1 Tax=Synechococcus sp. UW179A TaxID=2575510 RepID=UPI0010BED657|nr:hypothetical protein [Synechococcus sp. UW179A]